MTIKQELLSELDKIVAHTAEQTILRRRSNQYLYVGLAWVYLWWVRASKEKGCQLGFKKIGWHFLRQFTRQCSYRITRHVGEIK